MRLSPPWDFPKVLNQSGGIRDGASVELRVPVGPFSTHWKLEHRDYIANQQFRDVLLDGPFAFYEHTHSFESTSVNSSLLTDRIDYDLPLGAIGAVFGSGFAHQTFERVFHFRHTLMLNDLARHAQFADRGPMRIAVTGASGFIGSQLCAFLTTGGHTVLRIGRGAKKPGVVDIVWDPSRGVIDARALEGVDAVVHLAGSNIAERWTAARKLDIRQSRVQGTTLISNTLAQLERKPRVLVSASAIGIYGDRGDEILDESSSAGKGFLCDVVREWEASTEAAERAGIRVVHARTGMVQGAAGGALAKMLPFFRLGLGGPIAGGTAWVSPIALDDEIGAIHFCIMRDDVRGAVNLVCPTPVTNAEFTHTLGGVLRRPAFMPTPAFSLRLMFGEEMTNNTILTSLRVMPGALQQAGFEFRHPTVENMLRFELGELR